MAARQLDCDGCAVGVGSMPGDEPFARDGIGVGEIGDAEVAVVVGKKVGPMWSNADGGAAVDDKWCVCGCVCCVAVVGLLRCCYVCRQVEGLPVGRVRHV